jgi:hypothetical protein
MEVSWIRTTLLTLAAAAIALASQQLGDYSSEAAPSLEAIARGDLGSFASAATPYAGSLTLRAPFVALAGLLGGDRPDLYRAGVFACLLAAVALAIVLDRAAADRPPATRLATAAAVLGLPVVLGAFELGHPEELLTASLAVLAVWAAPRRPLAAGVLLGLAVACKPWALVAVGPVLLCATGGRLRLLAAAGAAGFVALAPFLADMGPAEIATASGTTGTLWVPFQVWWPLGTAHHHAIPDGVGGMLDAITWTAPGWLGTLSRGLIVGLTAPLAALAFARGRRSRADALLLLALLLHLRCALDPWNTLYYALPATLALVAWSVERRDALPVATAALAGLAWLSFHRLPQLSDERAVMYAGYVAWALPFAALLAAQLLGRSAQRVAERRQPVAVALDPLA